MPGLMDFDWQQYRDQAGQEARNLNQQAFVKDPAQLATTPQASQQELYASPTGTDNAVARSMIQGAFRQYGGRDPSLQDYQAWTKALASGLPIDQVLQGIAQTFQKDTAANPYGSSAGLMSAAVASPQFGGMGLMSALQGGGN